MNKNDTPNEKSATTQPISATVSSPPKSSIPSISATDAESFYRYAFGLFLSAATVTLDPHQIELNENYRIADREYDAQKWRDSDPIVNLRDQYRGQGFLNSIFIIEKDGKYILVGGKKRLKISERERKHIACRVVTFNQLFNTQICSAWSDEKKERMLSELCRMVTYSESAHTSPMKDSSIVSMFRHIQESRHYHKADFEHVMRLIGLERKSSDYRNLKRLWDVSCCAKALELIDAGKMHLSLLKKDHNLRPMEQSKKAQKIFEEVNIYTENLRRNSKDRNKGSKLDCQLQEYDAYEIEKIIRNIDMPGSSPESATKDRYRQPKFKTKITGSRLSIPATSLDFSDSSANNVRNLLETLFNLEDIADQLKRYLKCIAPEQAGLKVRGCHQAPTYIDYKKKYLDFIQSNNMELYANIQKIEEWFKSSGAPLATSAELSDKNSFERSMILIDKFIENSVKEKSNDYIRAVSLGLNKDHQIIETSKLAARDESIREKAVSDAYDPDKIRSMIREELAEELRAKGQDRKVSS